LVAAALRWRSLEGAHGFDLVCMRVWAEPCGETSPQGSALAAGFEGLWFIVSRPVQLYT
jgi:hypothetical protein